jgi:Ca2+-binding EF-hand superfamily protein
MLALVSAPTLAQGTAAPKAAAPAAPAAAGPVPVPRADFLATMDSEFKRMDANKDGILTRKEVEDYQHAVALRAAQERNVALFLMLDKDKNGTLTPAEFADLPMNMPEPNSAAVFTQTDLNRDGQINIVEYRTGKLSAFDRMDTDKDGVVTPAEMRAAGIIK